MAACPSAYLKHWLLLSLFCLSTLTGSADTLILSSKPALQQKIRLKPYLAGWEDPAGRSTPAGVLNFPERFVPLNLLQQQSPASVYWLKMTLANAASFDPAVVIRFSNLTYVDAYLYHHNRVVWHRRAGAFRPRSLIAEGDSRFHITLPPLAPKQTYTLLLRVHHTKGYQPQFDFLLQQKEAFIRDSHTRERTDAWSQGAVALFFLYTGLSWLVSRYRPYLWLLLFMGGVGLYGLCSGPYFINWFFPEHPATGWLFNAHFLHLGLLGFYLLVVEFWQLPKYNPVLYRFGKFCIAVLIAVSVIGFCNNYFTGNFNRSNTINLWAFLFPFGFVVSLLVRCYHRLDRAQKYLYYGIVLFIAAGLFITLSSAFFHEQSLLVAPYVSNFTVLAVFLLFTTGLKEALRQHEVDKLTALQQLSQLQQEQNMILEKKVEARTRELLQSNELLQAQTGLLAQRNATIETLMNELSHRVKNNLQLLYSLSSLQLPKVPDENTRQILKGNMARIKAMMLVNQKLDNVEETNLASLIGELARHLQEIYDRPGRIKILQCIPEEVELPSRQVLSLGLIITELMTNSFKYAFPNHTDPCISIKVTLPEARHIILVYADNGIGIKQGEAKPSSLGLSLIKDLARQLNGTLTIEQDSGLTYTFTIPE